MTESELLLLAREIHSHMQQLMDDKDFQHWEIAHELGSEEKLQMALLATAISEGLIEGSAALLPIFQEIEDQLGVLVEA